MAAGETTDGVGEQLMRVSRRLRRRWLADLVEFDLTPHHVRALRVIEGAPQPQRLREVAEALRIAPRSATDVVDALESRGYVVRAADPADRRATVVEATATGREVLGEVHARRRRSLDAPFAALSATQRRQLGEILAVLDIDD